MDGMRRVIFFDRMVEMSKRCMHLLIILLLIGCQHAAAGEDKNTARPESAAEKSAVESDSSQQLNINKEALFNGTTEQVRIDAAGMMLFSDSAAARAILTEGLRQTENEQTRMAICKALVSARLEQRDVKDEDGFIEPLLVMLTSENAGSAELASQTILIFRYEQLSGRLEKMADDSSLSVAARLNVIKALQMQPDMRAAFKLMLLLDDPVKEVSAGAEKSLQSMGVAAIKDTKVRKQVIKEMQRAGQDAFLRNYVVRRESRIVALKSEGDFWKEQYLASLSRIYDGITDDAGRGKFLGENLLSPRAPVRLLALEKIEQWRKGAAPKLPAELGPVLVNMISDPDRNVRLKIGQLLFLIGDLDTAQKLLEQINAEEDEDVRMSLFVALGGACHDGLSANAKNKISPEIRARTMELAGEYLSSEEPMKAQKGAEVVKKLLEQDGLSQGEADKYLGQLAARYKKSLGKGDSALQGELLNLMAGLCTQSAYSSQAISLFRPLFEEAIRAEANMVREAAVNGLIYIDKTVR